MRAVALLAIIILLFGQSVMAGCKSDCKDEYESEIDSCKMMYDDPLDSDDLSMCIDDAKSTYGTCAEECDN